MCLLATSSKLGIKFIGVGPGFVVHLAVAAALNLFIQHPAFPLGAV